MVIEVEEYGRNKSKISTAPHGVLTSGRAFAAVAVECAMNTSESFGP
jgi:hypothetical protein